MMYLSFGRNGVSLQVPTKPMSRLYLSVAFLASFFCSIAQTDQQVASYFQEVRKGKALALPLSTNDSNNSEKLVASLIPFLKDSSEAVRSKDILILRDIGINSKQPAVRKKVASELAMLLRANDQQRTIVLSSLRRFAKSDYEPRALDSLLKFMDQKLPRREELIRLIGFAGNPEAIEKIRKFSTPENGVSLRWSTLLALARLGDQEAINSVLQRAKKLRVNDEVVTQLFPDLMYTRQKQVIDYPVEVLMSSETNCESADNDNPTAIVCGYRVMEQLASAIKNYPLTLDASGDVKTSDYKKSLETVREWFQQNKDTYLINTSTF